MSRPDPTGDPRSEDPLSELDVIIAEYIRADEAGEAPDRKEFLERCRGFESELEEFFANRDRMQRLAEPLRGGSWPGPLHGKIRYFGDYELIEEIARGGMGVVYRARQVSLDRLVALKMVAAGRFASKSDMERFRIETEAAAKLDHPHIVPIYEVGEQDGQQYFSMKLVEGESLAERLARSEPRPDESVRLIASVARAVHHAHERGVLHRDLKPGNILLDVAGTPYVSDFGLAKKLDQESSFTRTGAALGTPAYMAPEQAGGRSREVTMATDVWGLGAILYHALTGRPPFQSERSIETLRLVCEEEPARPRLLNASVPRDLETICLKCLEKDPARRYASAAVLAEDLENFLAGRPITARRITPWERVIKWARRKPAKAGLVLVSVVATVLLAGGLAVHLVTSKALERTTEARDLLEEQEKKTQAALASRTEALELLRGQEKKTQAALASRTEALASLEEVRQREKRTAYFDRLLFAERVRSLGHLDEANAILDECAPGLRGWEWGYLKKLYEAGGTLPEDSGSTTLRAYDVKFSPDGRLVATAYGIWDVVAGKMVHEFRGNNQSGVGFSPDGRSLAFGRGGDVRLLDVESGRETLVLSGHRSSICTVAFSPDGKLLASASVDDTVRVWDLESAREVHTFHGSDTSLKWFSTVVFSPDGTRLAAGYQDGTVWTWNVVSGARLQVLEPKVPGGAVTCVAFSPDGTTIAGASSKCVTIWDAQSGKKLRSHAGRALALAFSPGGLLAISGRIRDVGPRTLTIWEPASEREILTLEGGSAAVAFSPEGRYLAVAGVTVRILEGVLPLDFAFKRALDEFRRRVGVGPTARHGAPTSDPPAPREPQATWAGVESDLDELLPLSARRRLEQLVVQADELWPAHPTTVPVIERLLETARELAAELDRVDAPWKAIRDAAAEDGEHIGDWESLARLRSELENQERKALADGAAAVLSFGGDPSHKPITSYFRHPFPAPDLSETQDLRLRILVDDGAVVFLNGGEIARVNMPEGDVGPLTTAASTIDTATDFLDVSPDRSPILRPGRNVLAVEVHQASPSSSDIVFDLELVAGERMLVNRHSSWRYAGHEQDVDVTWRDPDYDDSSWASGPAPLGYGFKTGPGRLLELRRAVEQVELIETIETFLAPETGTVASIEKRLEQTTVTSKLSLDDHREDWDQVIRSIAESPRYGGLRLRPQYGLVPIGSDPQSGLWEFAHLESGKAPRRDAMGRLLLTDETGVVFVLIPGGTFLMGAEGEPAKWDESPVREARLGAFFLSKFEMTQAQWERLTGENPSRFVSPRHPVEQVSWQTCREALWRRGLALPTEAQWEYAARGGTTTAWWTGSEKSSLRRAGNLADITLRRLGAGPEWPCEEDLYDGHGPHAPVGSFRANPFGLHDVVGNVQEWCLDSYGSYELPVREVTGERIVKDPAHVHRGGSWTTTADACRSTARGSAPANLRDVDLGVRPARAVE